MHYVIVGASRGLGLALAEHIPKAGDCVHLVSRTRPGCLDCVDEVKRYWLECDLADPGSVEKVLDKLSRERLNGIIYTAGIWENDECLSRISVDEIYRILCVNLGAFISLSTRLASCFEWNARIVGIGSMYGIDNGPGGRIAYSASKSGMLGAVHSLREVYRDKAVGVTYLAPGAMNSRPNTTAECGDASPVERRVRFEDILSVIRIIFALSPSSTIKEIHMPEMFHYRETP